MTRILSLGQNNGMTVMILNLAPTKAYHQDTLSALNFANRAKKIEIKNTPPKITHTIPSLPRTHLAPTITGAAVRSFGAAKPTNANLSTITNTGAPRKKTSLPNSSALLKKPLPSSSAPLRPQPAGIKKPPPHRRRPSQSNKENDIESIVERKVAQMLAAAQKTAPAPAPAPPPPDQNAAINRRLEQLEARVAQKADAKSEGLTYILLAKQHAARHETVAALKMFQLAAEYFPGNAKLEKKITDLQELRELERLPVQKPKKTFSVFTDADGSPVRRRPVSVDSAEHSPRTRRLLAIVNSEDVEMIMQLKGVGKKRAESLAQYVKEARENAVDDEDFPAIKDLRELGMIRGIGGGMVENMRSGIPAGLDDF